MLFSFKQSLHVSEVGLYDLALAARAQVMVKSLSSTNPLSFKLQMCLLKQVLLRLLGCLKSALWLPFLSFHSGSTTPR